MLFYWLKWYVTDGAHMNWEQTYHEVQLDLWQACVSPSSPLISLRFFLILFQFFIPRIQFSPSPSFLSFISGSFPSMSLSSSVSLVSHSANWLIGRLIQPPLGSDWKISTTTGWIDIKFSTDMNCSWIICSSHFSSRQCVLLTLVISWLFL